MTKRAGKKTTVKNNKTANKRSTPASRTPRKKKPQAKKAATAGRPRGSRGKNTTGEDDKISALTLAPQNSREGQIQRGLIALGLLDDPTHLRGNLRLMGKAVEERWPSAAPEVNATLRQTLESLAVQMAAQGKAREATRCVDVILRMEGQNQRDQAAQIQRRDDERRREEAQQMLRQMQELVANASQNPAFFDALHTIESSGQPAGPREPRRLGNGVVGGGVEVIQASGDR